MALSPGMETFPCRVCGAPIHRPAGTRGKKPERCRPCRLQRERERIAAYRATGAHKRPVECETCGTEYLRSPGLAGRAFCSPQCRRYTFACAVCGGAYTSKSSRPGGTCSDTCRKAKQRADWKKFEVRYGATHGEPYRIKRNPATRRADGADRRARKKGAEVGERFDVFDLLARDGWTCALCGDGIPVVVQWPHLLYRTVDHVIPLANGGAHSMENAQPAHLSCNSSKQHYA